MAQQGRAAATRKRLVEAAGEVFDEAGYAGASTTEILARAGVTRGALHYHFPSKEALAEAVLAGQGEALVPPFHEIRLQSVIDLTHEYATRLQTNPVLRGAVRLATEPGAHRTAEPYDGPQSAVGAALAEARAAGELLAGVRVERATRLIVGAYTGIQLVSQILTLRADLPEQVTVMWQYLLPGLAVPELLPRLRMSPPLD